MSADEKFANDMLHFAARRFKASLSATLTVMVEHVPEMRWFDLYLDVGTRANFAHEEHDRFVEFSKLDGYCLTWVVPKTLNSDGTQVLEWEFVRDIEKRREVAERAGLVAFDSDIANRAIQYDGVIFLNQKLIDFNMKQYLEDAGYCKIYNFRAEDYVKLLITHECINMIEDFDHRSIIVGFGPDIPFDDPTLETFDAYTQESKK